jgi:hypothetical protein
MARLIILTLLACIFVAVMPTFAKPVRTPFATPASSPPIAPIR